VREIEPGTLEYEQAAELRYDALYREWGLPRTLIADTDGRTYRHVAAFEGPRVIGYGRIWLEDGESKIFQVCVAADRQSEGIGAAIVEELAGLARTAGRVEITLDARVHAIGFYERLGFCAEGEEFISGRTGTPHRHMRRSLAGM
jgi:ribosomal protein S18 acetylase RimI-like enzyme